MRAISFLGMLILVTVTAGASVAGAETPPPPNVPAADAVALEAAVRAYSAAFLANDVATAYAALSSDCQAELSKSELRRIVRPVAGEFGDAELVSFKITKFSGERARVTYRFDERALDVKKERWVNEDGAWRRDC